MAVECDVNKRSRVSAIAYTLKRPLIERHCRVVAVLRFCLPKERDENCNCRLALNAVNGLSFDRHSRPGCSP